MLIWFWCPCHARWVTPLGGPKTVSFYTYLPGPLPGDRDGSEGNRRPAPASGRPDAAARAGRPPGAPAVVGPLCVRSDGTGRPRPVREWRRGSSEAGRGRREPAWCPAFLERAVIGCVLPRSGRPRRGGGVGPWCAPPAARPRGRLRRGAPRARLPGRPAAVRRARPRAPRPSPVGAGRTEDSPDPDGLGPVVHGVADVGGAGGEELVRIAALLPAVGERVQVDPLPDVADGGDAVVPVGGQVDAGAAGARAGQAGPSVVRVLEEVGSAQGPPRRPGPAWYP